MSANLTGERRRRSVIAIAQGESSLKAVEIRRHGLAVEVLWAKSSGDSDWGVFASECGVGSDPAGSEGRDGHKDVVAGFGSSGVVFHRLDVPATSESEAESIVRLQAESRLPLPIDQMELAWRAGYARNGEMPVIMAAARREHLEEFVENVRAVAPEQIMLDCDGIVKAWRTFFQGDDRASVIISVSSRNSHVCLSESGRLSNAVVLDMGTDDFSSVGEAGGQTEAAERFVRDMKSVLEMFGYGEPGELPVIVLSDGGDAVQAMVAALESAELNVRGAMASVAELAALSEIDAADIYEYRVPLGLGLMALEDRADELNIFEHLYTPVKEEEEKRWSHSPKLAAAIAVVMLVMLLVVSYAVDAAKPGAIDKRLKAALSDTDMKALMERQGLRRAIAQYRPNVLEIISLINKCGEGGIKPDSVNFKRGQLASVTGLASGNAQLYKFEEALNKEKHISSAKIQSSSVDAKAKKIRFTINFKYKNFSDKTTR